MSNKLDKIKRFDSTFGSVSGGIAYGEMKKDENGDYVEYEDHMYHLQAYKDLLEKVHTLLYEISINAAIEENEFVGDRCESAIVSIQNFEEKGQ